MYVDTIFVFTLHHQRPENVNAAASMLSMYKLWTKKTENSSQNPSHQFKRRYAQGIAVTRGRTEEERLVQLQYRLSFVVISIASTQRCH